MYSCSSAAIDYVRFRSVSEFMRILSIRQNFLNERSGIIGSVSTHETERKAKCGHLRERGHCDRFRRN
jgi:DNA-directed RNA polymerase alpha subunit